MRVSSRHGGSLAQPRPHFLWAKWPHSHSCPTLPHSAVQSALSEAGANITTFETLELPSPDEITVQDLTTQEATTQLTHQRSCQRLGIKTVAVYSEADANALFVEIADEGNA